tara:strand:- start:78 stop:512 length:435 start_codon:yes stop_codon:yes gene_type:complete
MPGKKKELEKKERKAAIKKSVSKNASKLNVKKNVASAVKKSNTYQEDPRMWTVKDKDSYKGRNKSEVKLEKSAKRVGGMRSKMIGYNPYHWENRKLHEDMAKTGQKMHQETDHNMSKTMKKQAAGGPNRRDTPLPPTSDKDLKK